MNWLQNFIARLFRIEPARDRVITIREAHTFRENVIQNKLWYLGDGVTLEQYFKKTAKWDVEKARFWAATAQGNVRKIHSGIVGTVVDRYPSCEREDSRRFEQYIAGTVQDNPAV